MEEKETRTESFEKLLEEAARVDPASKPEYAAALAMVYSELGRSLIKDAPYSTHAPVESDLDARLRAIKPPEGRTIREGDYPPMKAVQKEDGTWVLVKREQPTTFWGRVKAFLF